MATIGLALASGPQALPLSPTFQDLYQKHSATVFRTALRVTGNAADAEDVLQTVFMRMLNPGVALEISFQAENYLRRAATNAAIDVIRKKASAKELPIDNGPERTTPAADALMKESVRRALARLDPEDAELFTLRNLDGFTYDELAEMFNIERGTVASRLHRIRQDLLVYIKR